MMSIDEHQEESLKLVDFLPKSSFLIISVIVTFVVVYSILLDIYGSFLNVTHYGIAQLTLLPCICFYISGEINRRGGPVDLAWGMFNFGWAFILMLTCKELIGTYMISGDPSNYMKILDLTTVCVTGLTIPVLLSIGLFSRLRKAAQGTHSKSRVWLMSFVFVGFIDITLSTALSIYIWQTHQ